MTLPLIPIDYILVLLLREETLRGLVLTWQAYTSARLVHLIAILLGHHCAKATPTAAIGLASATLMRTVHRWSFDVKRLCASLLVRIGGLCRR